MSQSAKKVLYSRRLAVNGSIPWHSYGLSLAIWDHTVLPATRHKWTHPALTPPMQAGTRFTYPGGMENWVDLVDLIAPRPGVEPVTFRSRVCRPTTAPPRWRDSWTFLDLCLRVCLGALFNFIFWSPAKLSWEPEMRYLFALTSYLPECF